MNQREQESTSLVRGARWEIAEHLRRRIIAGEIPRASRLPTERELAEQLGVARTTLREALQILKDEGFLKTVRGRSGGSVVTDLVLPEELWYERIRRNPAELDELFEFRIAVERMSAGLAAVRRDQDDLAEMRASIEMLKGTDTVPQVVFREADASFHSAIARASRNQRLITAIRAARGEILFPFDTLPHPVYIAPTLEGHAAIFNAIEHMDGGAASAAMESHLDRTRVELRTIIFMTANRESDVDGR